ncbi:MAG: glycosyltransferase family 39 protein [Gammaproteobacteria bacterium]
MTRTPIDPGLVGKNQLLLLTLLLTVIAAIPRLYSLGELSFYMDEETTAFASRAMAEGLPPAMPSGMPYHRAIPQSFINALSAKIFGLDNEFSYRLPSALFGILTVPLIFLLVRPYTGTSAAFLIAMLLALSEWHIFTSRQARMYAPFMFFYIACTFSILRWSQSNKNGHLFLSLSLFIAALSLHKFAVFAALIPFVVLFVQDYAKTPTYKLMLFSIFGGLSTALFGIFYVNKPYKAWKAANGIEIESATSLHGMTGSQILDWRIVIATIVSLFLGIWLARQSATNHTGNGKYIRVISHYTLAILFAGFAVTANIHGVFLSLLLLLYLYPDNSAHFLKTSIKPLAVIFTLAALSAGLVILDLGILPGIRSMVTLPQQYWTLLNDLSPGITLLFLASLIFLALGNKQAKKKHAYIFAICALLPLVLIGIVKQWIPARYIVTAYPFILITVGLFLHMVVGKFFSLFKLPARTLVTTTVLIIALTGLLGGHGAKIAYEAATLTYGENTNQTSHIFRAHPDHKQTGRYVAEHSKPDDIIIAEDILQQRWYAGRVDYWLRNNENHANFLYTGSDSKLHDIYVNSIAATPEILDTLLANEDKRIWLITSGETYYQRKHYLNNKQQSWLDAIKKNNTPVLTGRDNISFVYCLHCKDSQ